MTCFVLANIRVDGLAWDWIGKRLYMTDRPGNAIKRISPYNTSSLETLVTEDVKKPWGIVLDPCGNYPFFLFFYIMLA